VRWVIWGCLIELPALIIADGPGHHTAPKIAIDISASLKVDERNVFN
jgi:hypothetical protein